MKKLMRRFGILTGITVLAIFLALGMWAAPAKSIPGPELAFRVTKVSPNTDLEHPCTFLGDGIAETAWKAQSDGRDVWAEITLEGPRLIDGLRFYKLDGSAVEVYYATGSGWLKAVADSLGDLTGWQEIDLSPLQIVTDCLRIRLVSRNGADTVGLGEWQVFGTEPFKGAVRLKPSEIRQSANTTDWSSGGDLFDGNTYTPWVITKGEAGWVEADLPETSAVSAVKFFMSGAFVGSYSVQYRYQGVWCDASESAASAGSTVSEGWNEIAFVSPISTDSIRIEARPESATKSMLTEVEIWGFGINDTPAPITYSYSTQSHDSRAINWRASAGESYDVLAGSECSEAVLNDRAFGRMVAGQNTLSGNLVHPGSNNLTWHTRSKEGMATEVELRRWASDGRLPVECERGILVDGSTRTAAVLTDAETGVEMDLDGLVLVDHVRMYVAQNGQFAFRISLWNNEKWTSPTRCLLTASSTGWYQLAVKGVGSRIRLCPDSNVYVAEIQCFGSRTSQNPRIEITSPSSETVVDGNVRVSGVVDSPGLKVTVNGVAAQVEGNRFLATLNVDAAASGSMTISAVAIDTNGDTGRDESRVFHSAREPYIALDAAQRESFTEDMQWVVKGRVIGAVTELKVNGEKVSLQAGRFEGCVSLAPGANRIAITALTALGQKVEERVIVWRDSEDPVVRVFGPFQGEVIPGRSVIVSGAASDLTPVRVWVNDQAVNFEGNIFKVPVSLDQGSNVIHIRAIDALGRVSELSVPVLVDETAPEVRISEPLDGLLLKEDVPIDVKGVVTTENLTGLFVNDRTVKVDGRGTFALSGLRLNEGKNTISVKAEDAAGHCSASEVCVIRDISGPEVFKPQANPGGWIKQSSTTVVFEAFDQGSTVARYEANIDGKGFVPVVSPLTVSGLAEGSHSVVIRAFDEAGHYTDGTVNFGVDLGAPAMKVPTSSASGWASRPITIAFEASDDISGVEGYELSVDDNPAVRVTSPFTLPEMADGEHNVRVFAFDKAGNRSETVISVQCDRTGPVPFEVSAPDQWVRGRAMISFATDDVTSGLDHYDLRIDGGRWVQITSPYELPAMRDGVHSVEVRAVDRAGMEMLAKKEVRIDNTAPINFTPIVKPEGWSNDNQPTIEFRTDDSTSGLAGYEISVDGGPFAPAASPFKCPELGDGVRQIRVRAVDKAGNERVVSASAYVDTTPPAVPAGFKALKGSTRVRLVWQAVPGARGYQIRRSAGAGERIRTVGDCTTYMDVDVADGTTYTYSIKAVDEAGNESAFSAPVSVTTGMASMTISPSTKLTAATRSTTISDPPVVFESASITVTFKSSPSLNHLDGTGTQEPVSNATLAAEEVDPAQLPGADDGSVLVGVPVVVGIVDQATGVVGDVSLTDAADLQFYYNTTTLPAGYDEAELRLYRYDTELEQWLRVTGSNVNLVGKSTQNSTNTREVSAPSDDLTIYAVRASRYEAPSTEEYDNMNVSPMSGYFTDHDESVSPESGALNVSATDVRIPGVNGLGVEIVRSYNTATAYAQFRAKKLNDSRSDIGMRLNSWRCLGLGWELDIPYIEGRDGSAYVHFNGSASPIGEKVSEKRAGWGPFTYVTRAEYVNFKGEAFKTSFFRDSRNAPRYHVVRTCKGLTYIFKDNLLISVSDRNDNRITYAYDGQKRLSTIIDTVGRAIAFSYGSNGRLASISWAGACDGSTVSVRYGYDSASDLNTVTDPMGRMTTYRYSPVEAPTMDDVGIRISDNAGHVVTETRSRRNDDGTETPVSSQTNTVQGARFENVLIKLLREVLYPSGGKTHYEYGVKTYSLTEEMTHKEYSFSTDADGNPINSVTTVVDVSSYDRSFIYVTARSQYQRGKSELASLTSYSVEVSKDVFKNPDKPTETLRERQHLSKTTITRENAVTEMLFGLRGVVGIEGAGRETAMTFDGRENKCTAVSVKDGTAELSKVTYDYSVVQSGLLVSEEKHLAGTQELFRISSRYDGYGNRTYRHDSSTGLEEWWAYNNMGSWKDANGSIINSRNNNGGTGFQAIGYTGPIDSSGVDSVIICHSTRNKVSDPAPVTQYLQILNEYYSATVNQTTLEPGKTVSVESFQVVTNLSKSKVWNGSSWDVTSYINDVKGNVTEKQRPGDNGQPGPVTKYYYEHNNGEDLTKVEVSGVVNADGASETVVTQYTYYDNGLRATEVDPRSYTTSYAYDKLGRMTKITYPDDSYRTYRFDDAADLCDLTDEEGRVARFEYDGLGHLISVTRDYGTVPLTNRLNAKTVYAYDKNLWKISKVVEPHTATEDNNDQNETRYSTSYEYDALSRVVKVTFPYDKGTVAPVATLAYDPATNLVTILDENGNVTKEQKDWAGRLTQATVENKLLDGTKQSLVWTFGYDSLGRRVRETHPGNGSTYYQYNVLGRLTSKLAPKALSLHPETDNVIVDDYSKTTYGYDARGNWVWEIGPDGNAASSPQNYQVQYRYDFLDRLIQTDEPYSDTAKRTTKVYYDAAGNRVKVTDGNSLSSTYGYDARGRLLSEKNGAGETVWYTYDRVGNQTSITDPRGKDPRDASYDKRFTTWLWYDALNRQVRVVLPDNTPPLNPQQDPGDNPYVSKSYTLNGLLKTETDANGIETTCTYTARGWIESTYRDGIRLAFNTYDKAGNLETSLDATGRFTKNENDSLGHPLRTRLVQDGKSGQSAREQITRFEYNGLGQKIAEWSEYDSTRKTVYGYDAQGRPTSVTSAIGKSTLYQYSPAGQLRQVTDALGNRTTNQYNRLGWLVKETDSLGKATIHSYDVGGRRASVTDRKGQVTQFSYLGNNRLSSVIYGVGLAGNQTTVSYNYDAAGNRTMVTQSGAAGDVKTYYNYESPSASHEPDPLNRVNKTVRVFESTTAVTRYRYDKAGNVTGICYPGSTTWVEYNRDSFNRVKEIPGFTAPATVTGGQTENGVTYDEAGVLKRIHMANGVDMTVQPDELHMPSSIEYRKPGQDALLKLDYQYETHQSSIKAIAERGQSPTNQSPVLKAFDYDKLDQLTMESLQTGDAITRVCVGSVTATATPGGQISVTYNWMASPTKEACAVETTFIDSTNGTVLWRFVHDPANYNSSNTLWWSGPINYTVVTGVPSTVQYNGTVIVAVALVNPSGVRQLLVKDDFEQVFEVGPRCYQIGSLALQTTNDSYHTNLASDDFRDSSRIDLQSTALCDSANKRVIAARQVVAMNQVVHTETGSRSSSTTGWTTVRSFTIDVDSRDLEYAFISGVQGPGYFVIEVDGQQISAPHYTTSSTARTYTDVFKLGPSGSATASHFVAIKVNPNGLGTVTNTSVTAALTSVWKLTGGELTATQEKAVRQRIAYQSSTDLSGKWTMSHSFKQDGSVNEIEVQCTFDNWAAGIFDMVVNGQNVLHMTVGSSGTPPVMKTIATSQYAQGTMIDISATFKEDSSIIDPPDQPPVPKSIATPSSTASVQLLDPSVSRQMEVFVTKKKVETRSYRLLTRCLESEQDIAGIGVPVDCSGVHWESLVSGKTGQLKATITQQSDVPLIEIKGYTSALTLKSVIPDMPNRKFSYDAAGNRQKCEEFTQGVISEGYLLYPGTNRIKQVGSTTYTYDDNGNMIQRIAGSEVWNYQYDARDRMVKVTETVNQQVTVIAEYAYDPEGNRIKASYPSDGSSVKYQYDLTGQLTENPIIEDRTGQVWNFIYLNRKLLTRVDGTIDSGTKYWYLTDHLGSARGLADAQGALVWWADYEAFGRVKETGGSLKEIPRFTGKAWDEKVGLYCFNARWFDPATGSFSQEDPLAEVQGAPNQYGYVFNNPLLNTDPTGMFVERSDVVVEAPPLSEGPESVKVGTWGVVEKGDTLETVAQKVYGDGSLWPYIAEANGIKDPKSIQPGQALYIPDLKVNDLGNGRESVTFVAVDPEVVKNTASKLGGQKMILKAKDAAVVSMLFKDGKAVGVKSLPLGGDKNSASGGSTAGFEYLKDVMSKGWDMKDVIRTPLAWSKNAKGKSCYCFKGQYYVQNPGRYNYYGTALLKEAGKGVLWQAVVIGAIEAALVYGDTGDAQYAAYRGTLEMFNGFVSGGSAIIIASALAVGAPGPGTALALGIFIGWGIGEGLNWAEEQWLSQGG